MPRRPAHHRVKIHQVYTVHDAAECVGVHRRTVANWISRDGLKATTTRPKLIEGADLKSFLIAWRGKSKRPLAPGEIFCLPCREPKRPAGDFVEAAPLKGSQWVLSGICPDCDRIINRYAAGSELARVSADLEVIHTGASERLKGGSAAPVNIPLRKEAQTHV